MTVKSDMVHMSKIPFDTILAGNATITVVSQLTGNRFTYKVIKSRKNENVFFVKVLTGSDNESSYSYLGWYDKLKDRYLHSVNSGVRYDALSNLAAEYLFKFKSLGKVDIYHSGTCCKCGRKLTTPESIKSGIGPKCKTF